MQLFDLLFNQYSDLTAYLFALFLGLSLGLMRLVSLALMGFIAKVLVRLLYPSLILASITTQYTPRGLMRDWPVPLLVALIIVIGHLIGKVSARRFPKLSPSRLGTFRFMSAVPNYIFLPLPICEYLWGPSSVAILIFSTLGADLTMWGLAVPQLRKGNWLSNLISVPFLALILAIILVFLGSQQSYRSSEIIHYLRGIGTATIPLSLFLLGCHLSSIPWTKVWTRVHLFLVFTRQILVPSLFFMVLLYLPIDASAKRILLLVSCMPTAIASVILAEMYQGHPKFAAEQILVSHIIAVPTTYLWVVYGLPYLL